MSRKSLRLAFVLILFLAVSFASLAAAPARSAQLVPLRVGMMPYLDWQPLVVGDRLGYFAEEGIAVEFTYFPDDITVGEAVASGNVDIGVGNSASAILLHARFPNLVRVGFDATWRGSAIMVKGEDIDSGKFKTYHQFYDEYVKTMTPEEADKKAVADTCAQLKGAEIIMDRGTSTASRLAACFPPAGISYDDITVIDMPDPEGAVAFLAGTGDFEMGGFPQLLAIQAQGGKVLISGVELGGPSVLVSDEFTTQEYLDANYDTIVKARKVWYRVIDQMYEDPGTVLPVLADIISKASGTTYTTETIWPEPDNMDSIMSQITLWPRLADVESFYFDEQSKNYWRGPYDASVDFWVNISQQVKAEDVHMDTFADTVQKIVKELLAAQ